MYTNKIIFLTLFGILFLTSVALIAASIYTSDTVFIVWNAVNMFVSAFFLGLTLQE